MSGQPVAAPAGQLLAPSRYRHPGDVIRLIAGGAVLACAAIASAAASRWLHGPLVAAPGGIGPNPVSRALTGIVQGVCVAAAVLVVAATLRHRRFRLLGGLARDRILVECALTSNYQTGAASRSEPHPIVRFLEAGIPVAICTDNTTVSATNQTRENALVAEQLGVGPLAEIHRAAAAFSFIAGADLEPRRLPPRSAGGR